MELVTLINQKMKFRILPLATLLLALAVSFPSCKSDDEDAPQKNIAKLGAQTNNTVGGFFSTETKMVYSQDLAFENQAKIDLLCFYEEGDNKITLAGPGSRITDIFTGETSPENWTTQNETHFTETTSEITVAQFDQIQDGNEIIRSYFNETQTSGYRKAKDLQVDDIRAFMTVDSTFVIYKVLSVAQGADGFVEFEYKKYKVN